jgi:outer membrane protein TolC
MGSYAASERAAGRFQGLMRLALMVPAALTLIAGCATDSVPRSLEHTYPPAKPQKASETGTTATPSPSTVGTTPVAREAAAGPALLSAIPATSPSASAPSAFTHFGADPGAKRVAGEVVTPVPSPLVIPPPEASYPIDLATALRLADVSNPTIGAARTMILEALARQIAARSLLLPSLNYGASYVGHNGALQRPSGKILDVASQNVYVGAGVNAVGSGTVLIPGVNIFCQLTDAWFEPLVARQRLAGAKFGAQATSYDILLDVALLHIELIGNQSILEWQRLSESQFHEVYRLTNNYAEAGEGRESDAYRALSQWKRRSALVQKAEEDLAVAAARLANRLNLDPSTRLEPIGGPLVPLNLIPVDAPQQELIKLAMRQRPDIEARTAAIAEAEYRRKQEIGRPLLPTTWIGFSAGAFGGGSNLNPPLVGNFAGRSDFDVRIYWTLLNFGVGNLALIKQRDAEIGQAIGERSRTINRARDEVSSALANARSATNQVDVARRELTAAEDAYAEDLDRTMLRGGEKARDVLPIELLNSLTLLADSRVNLVRALVQFDQSQYRLWVSLGSPPPLTSD